MSENQSQRFAFFEDASIHPILILFLGFIYLMVSLIFAQFVSAAISGMDMNQILSTDLSQTDNANRLKIAQGLMQCLGFGGAALFLSGGYRDPEKVFRLKTSVSWQLPLLAMTIMLLLMPIMQLLALDPNSPIIPEEVRKLILEQESDADKRFIYLLRSDLWLNIIIIGILPGVMEELFFRGFVQYTLERIFSIHWAIFIAAFIFSFMHFQFLGFGARLAMGMLFSYLMVWSGSIIPAMCAHAANNTSLCIYAYWAISANNLNTVDEPEFPFWIHLPALCVAIVCLWYFRKHAQVNSTSSVE